MRATEKSSSSKAVGFLPVWTFYLTALRNRRRQRTIAMRPVACSALRLCVRSRCRPGTFVVQRRGFVSKLDQAPEIYDVVCVGGGPAGLGLLAALRMLDCLFTNIWILTAVCRGIVRDLETPGSPRRNPGPPQGPHVEFRTARVLQPG